MKTRSDLRENALCRVALSKALQFSHDRRTERANRAPAALTSWRDIERAMDHAHNLRAAHLGALVARGFCYLRRVTFGQKAQHASESRLGAMRCALLLAMAATLAGFVVASGSVPAQERMQITAGPSEKGDATDAARLGEMGLNAAEIETCEDAALLWRAVRELVLPQRISEPMQRRILRRVWIVDATMRNGSFVDSATN